MGRQRITLRRCRDCVHLGEAAPLIAFGDTSGETSPRRIHMTTRLRLVVTLLSTMTLFAIVAIRAIYFFPGRPIPLTEMAGGLCALLLTVFYVWTTGRAGIHETLILAVQCISSGLMAILLWITSNHIVALLCGSLSVLWSIEWVKRTRNPERQ